MDVNLQPQKPQQLPAQRLIQSSAEFAKRFQEAIKTRNEFLKGGK
jgi:hypothetical protein